MVRETVSSCILLLIAMACQAPDSQAAPGSCGADANYVEKTIYVPTWVTETRTCKETRYRKETQQRKCTTYRCEKVTKQVPCQYTVWQEVEKAEDQTFEVATPVYAWVDQKCVEYKKGTEKVSKTRKVRKCIPVTETRKVCKDKGEWVEREVECCDSRGNKTTKKVRQWQPNVVEEEVEVTCHKWVCVEEPYECEVEVCVPIEKTRRVKQWDTRKEKKTVTNRYKTLEPVTKTKMRTVCVTEQIPVEKTYDVCVCVPYTVEKEVQVKVCRMVPKKIKVPAKGGCD